MTYLYLHPVNTEAHSNTSKTTPLGEVDGRQRYLAYKVMPDLVLVGQWDNDGTKVFCDETLFTQFFEAFGNDADGMATDNLNVQYYQGHKQRQMQGETPTGQPEYPVDNQPFSILMEHHEITDGAWQGHGWKATMLTSDPNRNILARAIGIYSDPECTQYLYTTGAFIMTDTGEVDGNNDPIYRPITECPLGQLKAIKEPIYFALLLGAAQEGIMNLPVEQNNITKNFWLN